LLVGCELLKGRRDVGLQVVRDGNDEEGLVGKDPGPACDRLEREAAVTFDGEFADGVVLVDWVVIIRYTRTIDNSSYLARWGVP
jgi:hypothetical protein